MYEEPIADLTHVLVFFGVSMVAFSRVSVLGMKLDFEEQPLFEHDFELGMFNVSPSLNQISSDGVVFQIEPLVMHVLIQLALRQGRLVLRAELLTQVWNSRASSDESLTRAISLLRKVLAKVDPQQKYIHTVPRRGYTLTGDVHCSLEVSKAEPAAMSGVGQSLADPRALFLQGRALLDRPFVEGVTENAILLLQEANMLRPDSAEILATLGEAYAQLATYSSDSNTLDRLESAAQHARKALVLEPDLAEPKDLIALHHFANGDMATAVDLALEAYEQEPENANVAMRLGYFLAMIGLTKRAIPFYEIAVNLDPAKGRNLQCLAQAKLCDEDLTAADQLSKRAIELQHMFAHDTFAAVAYARGNYALAAERFTAGCFAMHKMFGENFSDPDTWIQFSGLVFSRDEMARKAVANWVKRLCERPGKPATIPYALALVRTGSAQMFFEACGDKPPFAALGVMLRLWGGVDTCKMIYQHPEFGAFADRIGLAEAWARHGLPDRLS